MHARESAAGPDLGRVALTYTWYIKKNKRFESGAAPGRCYSATARRKALFFLSYTLFLTLARKCVCVCAPLGHSLAFLSLSLTVLSENKRKSEKNVSNLAEAILQDKLPP